MNRPTGISVDSTGVYVAENQNFRALFFPGSSTTANRVYGQNNFTSNTFNKGGATSDTTVGSPLGVFADGAGLYLTEFHYRALYYSGTSTTATRVYGQAGSFTTSTVNNGGISATSLHNNSAAVSDASGVYIADYGNHRVLFFSGTSATATRVYGQNNGMATGTANLGGSVTAATLNTPYVAVPEASGVYIADTFNNRVLYFSGTSTTASRVYGQHGSFTTNTANNGGVSADSLNQPAVVVLGPSGIYISDQGNNRILYYPGTSTTATRVYGQNGNFTSSAANNGGVSAGSLNSPAGMFLYNGNLYVADSLNHRVLMY